MTLDGVAGADLARRWSVPQCALFDTHPSSLDAVHLLAAQGGEPGSVVVALAQTAGRGRDGRTWRSPVGGAWLAMLLRPAAAVLGATSLRVGLALADVVDDLLGGSRTQLKWPNDVLVDGRKLAGILCEGRWAGETLQWLGIGVGVNVANEIPVELRDRAIALQELRPGIRRIDLLDLLIPALAARCADSGRLTGVERSVFATRDWLRGRRLRAPVAGRAAGVRDDGALLVETDAGAAVVQGGHVELS